jgi:hypothetical protein
MVREVKNRWEMLLILEKGFGCDYDGENPADSYPHKTLLHAIVHAMSDADFYEIFQYICRMYDIADDSDDLVDDLREDSNER